MRCYFSGSSKKEPLFLIPHRKPHLMISFYEMTDRHSRKLLKSFIRQVRGQKERTVGSIFMDSGAYSLEKYYGLKKRGDYSYFDLQSSPEFRAYCDRYGSFLKSMEKEVASPDFIAANVDVIGSPDLTRKTQEYFEKEHDVRPVPVVHLGSSMEYLEHYLAQGYEMIGLGGFAKSRDEKKKIKWLDQAFKIICPESNKRLPTVKVHGFAMFDFKLLTRYPWWSVDATTWHNPAIMGYVYLPYWSKEKNAWDYSRKARIVNFSKNSQHKDNPGKHFTNITPEIRREVQRWLDEIKSEEFSMEGTEDFFTTVEASSRAEANLHYWKNLEESRPEWPHPLILKPS
jgi:hypothetical protein